MGHGHGGGAALPDRPEELHRRYPAQVLGGHVEAGVSQLSLDGVHVDSFPPQFDGVLVAKRVRVDPPAQPGGGTELTQLAARVGPRQRAALGRARQHAEHLAQLEFAADVKPALQFAPTPVVHRADATLVALAMADGDRVLATVEVTLLEVQCFADPQPGPPQHGDQRAQSQRG